MTKGENFRADLSPVHLTREAFGRRLIAMMDERGWSARDLLSRANIGRDQISKYRRGISLPTPGVVQKMAQAFGVTPEELLPNIVEKEVDRATATWEMKAHPDDPSKMWVRLNRQLSTKAALQIAQVIADDDLANRTGSGQPAAMRPRKD